MHLREGIALKAAVGFLKQFPCHLEVHGCFIHAAMSKVRGQQREHSLYVFPLAIPGQETSYGKAVAKIMQPRLIAGTVKPQHPGLLSQPFELVVGMIVSDHHPYLGGEECRWTLVRGAIPSPAGLCVEPRVDAHQPGTRAATDNLANFSGQDAPPLRRGTHFAQRAALTN